MEKLVREHKPSGRHSNRKENWVENYKPRIVLTRPQRNAIVLEMELSFNQWSYERNSFRSRIEKYRNDDPFNYRELDQTYKDINLEYKKARALRIAIIRDHLNEEIVNKKVLVIV